MCKPLSSDRASFHEDLCFSNPNAFPLQMSSNKQTNKWSTLELFRITQGILIIAEKERGKERQCLRVVFSFPDEF